MTDETTPAGPWAAPMPEETFTFMRDLLAAPSPVGYEGAMTFGVLEPRLRSFMPDGWAIHRYAGSASLVRVGRQRMIFVTPAILKSST